MMKIRKANTRGVTKNDWIESHRTFSNNSYFDPKYISWGNLKVINDDTQQLGNMVPNHEHKNLDILGYLVEGELEHWDSLNNVDRAQPGQIQHMWCGKSIWHTEASVGTVPARYLQIWITPKDKYRNTEPYYEIIEKGPEFGPIDIELHQDITIKAGTLKGKKTIPVATKAYLYVVKGTIKGKDFELKEGDGAELDEDLVGLFDAHIVLIEE